MTDFINSIGGVFFDWTAAVFIQTIVLVAVLWGADLFFRNRIRATLRYWIWMLVFVKLLLPPTLCVPTGIGYWLGRHISSPAAALQPDVQDTLVPTHVEMDFAGARSSGEAPPLPTNTAPAELGAVDSQRLTWQGGIFLLWGIGVLVFAAMVIQRLLFVRWLFAHAVPARDDLIEVLDQCRRRMRVRRRTGVRLSQTTFSPAVCGLLRPTILIPAAMLDRLPPEGLRAVLIHELAHVKRGDLWVNSLQTVLQVVYFYNPLVWLANVVVRRVREQAVDEMVLVALGAEARSYSNTLIDIAEMAFLRVSPALRLIGVAESRKSLEGRIKHMLTRPMPKNEKMGVIGVLVVVLVGAALLPMAKAQTQDKNDAVVSTQEDIRAANTPAASGDHHVSALPLTDLERTFVTRVLDLVAQVETDYPDKTEHWPEGPRLYHVDGQGQTTVWSYQQLWRRGDDCAEDEVGWGSSQSVHATAMYYLPDGTPLQSRWHERGGGMKDIRVKLGRTVGDAERVALIHTYRLPGYDDLLSRDGDQKKIVVTLYDDLPLKVVVRVDKPARLEGSWAGDAQTVFQDYADYDEVLVSGPPRSNRGPMIVTIRLPEDAAPGVSAGRQESDPAPYLASVEHLVALGKAALLYAIDHRDSLPDQIEDLPDDPGLPKSWLLENVTYLGRGLKTHNEPDTPIAYDKTLLLGGQGTNVLRLDTQVILEPPGRIKDLVAIALREASCTQLASLGKSLLIYAKDHQDKYPDTLDEARDYISENGDFSWVLANVAYLGKGGTPQEEPGRVLAYNKTLLEQGKDTVVLYRDCHLECVPADRLPGLAITTARPDAGASQGALRSYQVNRNVAGFPPGEDFSTPEAAYATVNRMNWADSSAWRRVSAAAAARRMSESTGHKGTMDPEWAKVLQNAFVREVMVWNMTRAAVIAELPQGLSSKKVTDPIDRRSFELENGRWLNTGESRFKTVEEARLQFAGWMEREASQQEAMRDPLRHAGEIKKAAAELFERLRTADYAGILSHYRDGKWESDVWQKFPTYGLYTVHTDYPGFVLWCCTHFKDNPIVDVQLGDVFISDALVAGRTNWPTVPYRLTLRDGTTLAGNLPFDYEVDHGQGHWQAMEGIDWHLWPEG